MASIDDQVPSKDPADDGTLAGAFRSIFKKLMQGVDGMLPAIVVSYDRTANVAIVKPLVQLLTTEGKTLPRASIANVPVLALGGGGFVINFPVKDGDFGWIEASDRDISLYMQSQADAQPNTTRIHSFSDGRFVPDIMRNYTMPEDANAETDMIISSIDGMQAVIMQPGGVLVHADRITGHARNGADITTDAGDINITAGGKVNITGSSVVINGIPFETHKHLGTQPGSGESGGPTS